MCGNDLDFCGRYNRGSFVLRREKASVTVITKGCAYEARRPYAVLPFCKEGFPDICCGCMFKILVVEGDKALNRTVCSFLNQSGYETVGCLNANEAYDALYGGKFLRTA